MSDETLTARLREAEVALDCLRDLLAEQQTKHQIEMLKLQTKYWRLRLTGCDEESGRCSYAEAMGSRYEVQ